MLTIDNYVGIVAGVIAIICGPLIIRHRVTIYRVVSDSNRAFFGKVGGRVSKGSSPWWIGFCGAGLLAIGVGVLLMGIFARV